MTVTRDYDEYTQQLLELGADPNYSFSSILGSNLKIAIGNVNIKTIELLLHFGARNTELEYAVERGNMEIIKLLINRPDMSFEQLKKGMAAAHKKNDPNILKLLTDAQA